MTPRLSWLLAPLAIAAALPLAAQTAPQTAPTQVTPPTDGASPAAQAGQTPPPLEVSVTGGISAPMPIAIPEMPAAADIDTAAGKTGQLGRELSGIVTNDLKSSGLFAPLGPDKLHPVSYPEVTAPAFDYWGGTGAQALVQGFIRANGDGSLTVGCYLYDVLAKTELMRQGFVVRPAEWRRAAHKCADMVYTRLTGEGGYFDSRILYVAETGPKGHRVKRMAIMDQDGFNHRFLTNGQATVLNPQLSRDERRIVYMSYQGNRPQVWVYDLASGSQHPIVSTGALTFAPRFSPDGHWILFSMAQNGNTDVYKVRADGGAPQRLTDSPGIDTGGSFSPDGSRIVFESDRSGGQQLYVMNADGSNQHRITFGSGRYATPAWSPRGDLIAFTKLAGGEFRIGVVDASGGGEHLLTDNWQDEGPSWAPNGRVITFFRSTQGGSGRSDLYSVDLTGVNERPIKTPLDGSDPFWGPLRP